MSIARLATGISRLKTLGIKNLRKLPQLLGLSPLAESLEQFKPCPAAAQPARVAGLGACFDLLPAE